MERRVRTGRLDKGIKGWIVNHAKRNHWRVSDHYELNDLIQEGYFCYAKCYRRYGHVQDQAHFMALVKRTFANHCFRLAEHIARLPDIPISQFVKAGADVTAAMEELLGPVPEEASFAVALRQLPGELQSLLSTLLNDAASIPYLIRADRTRETTNEHLCRIGNLTPGTDVEALLREAFDLA